MREQRDLRDLSWPQEQLAAILNFWYPAAVDRRHGGFLNRLDGDGSVLDGESKHLVASARFAVLFSLGTLTGTGGAWCQQAAADAVDFLWKAHRDPRHGGYYWILRGDKPADPRKQSYGHAFVVLAGAMAHRAGVAGARALMEDAIDVCEKQFFRGGDLALNTASEDFAEVTAYRGQNPNMHFCEAFIAAYEATGHAPYLDKAYRIADVLARRMATRIGGFVWENYDADWQPDWGHPHRDKASIEAANGFVPGHQVEWAKLLGILARYRDEVLAAAAGGPSLPDRLGFRLGPGAWRFLQRPRPGPEGRESVFQLLVALGGDRRRRGAGRGNRERCLLGGLRPRLGLRAHPSDRCRARRLVQGPRADGRAHG